MLMNYLLVRYNTKGKFWLLNHSICLLISFCVLDGCLFWVPYALSLSYSNKTTWMRFVTDVNPYYNFMVRNITSKTGEIVMWYILSLAHQGIRCEKDNALERKKICKFLMWEIKNQPNKQKTQKSFPTDFNVTAVTNVITLESSHSLTPRSSL